METNDKSNVGYCRVAKDGESDTQKRLVELARKAAKWDARDGFRQDTLKRCADRIEALASESATLRAENERLKQERDAAITAYNSEKGASAHYFDLLGGKAIERLEVLRRAEAAERRLAEKGQGEAVAYQRQFPDGTWSDDVSTETGVSDEWRSWGFGSRPLYALATPPSPEPITVETRDRKTFSVPDGYEAVRDADGRATGQIVRKPEPDEARPVVKALDLSNLLKHAFGAGYMSAAGDSDWVDYDPTTCAAYARIRSALIASPVAEPTEAEVEREKRFPDPGDKMIFLNRNGYDAERERAAEAFETGQEYTVKSIDIGGWSSSICFEEVHGAWNSVMFGFAALRAGGRS